MPATRARLEAGERPACMVPLPGRGGDWKAVLAAFDGAAKIVGGKPYAKSGFLGGSALAAQGLRRNDLPARAWRAAPNALRLRRWLGSATSAAGLKRRAAEALGASPKQVHRQRALVHALLR